MKKRLSKVGLIVSSSICGFFSIALAVGTAVAYNYESLIDVFLSNSDYQVTSEEKLLCEDVVKEGAVLLKNDAALPLKESERKVAIFGQNSVDFVYGGSGSGSVSTASAPTIKKAFEDNGFTVNGTLWDFYESGPGKGYRKKTPDVSGAGTFVINEVPLNKYTDSVKSSLNDDFAICIVGRSGGESADIPLDNLASGYGYLEIDKDEQDMIKLACSKFEKVILLVNANNPIELGFLDDDEYSHVKAALWVGGVGQEGLYAIPKLLKGDANFSGRLVDTYAYDSKSAPSFQNMGDFTITNSTVTNGNKYLVYAEGVYVGYKYYETRYEDVVLGNTTGFDYSSVVQFPFGYGLSYSTFSWSDFTVTENVETKSYDLSLKVTNTSDVEGKDVVQFYVQKPYYEGSVEKPSVELVEFKKTNLLQPNESQTVSVTVSKDALASYDAKTNKTYILDKGDYYFAVGKNAHTSLNNILALKGKTTANGMTENGNETLAKKFLSLDSVDATSCSKSKITGANITNAFDDVDVNYYEEFEYLSRSDWEGTFPQPFKNRSWSAPTKLLNDLEFFDVSSDTSDDSMINAFNYRSSSTSTSYKVQDLIGVDYTDPRWDDLIAEMSFTQQTKLIRLGGYATQRVDVIGLPSTQDKDGPSGISGTLVGGTSCMSWPAEIVMASTWNVEMIEKLGELFGKDSISAGVAGVYGPACDIHRSPYSGRNFEYFSEDAILSYKMAGSEMKGLRSKGVIAYVKHYLLNDQETNRYGGALFANEQSIRELYLKGFEGAVVEGKSVALMAAMNRVGARWVGAHKGAMTTVLRNEWDFKGVVITDQASVRSMFYQDMVSGLWAGCDMWLNTNSSFWSLSEYKEDPTMLYYIHRAAKNIVYAVTNSWAVNDNYRVADGEEVIETNVDVFPWRPVLWTLDGVVWATTLTLCALTAIVIIIRKKEETK